MTKHTFQNSMRGFSLLEVLVAVVVLSTGLLALAALQGSLSRASADAKVRSQVAALLQARMDQLRTVGYNAVVTGVSDSCATNVGATDGSDWVPASFCTQNGLGALSATQTVAVYTSAVGAANFAIGAPGTVDDPQFKRITLAATWTDATGGDPRRLAFASDISELGLKDNLVVPPDDSNLGGQAPIVRQASPATAGVIPIAIGGSDATAATNPRPEILGKNNNQSIVGTQFTVLTYTNETNAARIQRRVENSLVHCTCQYGAGGSNLPAFQQQAQWPAVWTGETYQIYAPNPAAVAPGSTLNSGPASGVTQSPLCTECCRDHHDTNASGVAKFDPERDLVSLNDGYKKYSINNQGTLTAVNNTSNGTYLNSCRVIRVDGFWRTAADTYARHFGLLATETVGGKVAATGVPSSTATTAYQTFVKDYLDGYTSSPVPDPVVAPSNADALFAAPTRGLNDPTSITIGRPSPKDERYLHARGLYVDHLESEARDKLVFELNRCSTTPVVECILPFLPFTTINVTELAFWEPQVAGSVNKTIIDVATGSSLIFDPTLPTRGRTNALSTTTNGATADATAKLSSSNSGLAISSRGVDPQDDINKSDAQTFVVSAAGTPGSGGSFSVNLIGLPQTGDSNTSNDPAVAWFITSQNGNCNASVGGNDRDPNAYACNTTVTLGVGGNVLVSNYFREFDVSQSVTATCSSSSGNVSVTETIAVPTFANYSLNSSNPAGSISVAAEGKQTEVSTVSFAAISDGAVLNFTFGLQSNVTASIASCTATRQNSNKPWVYSNIVWNKPWVP